jgi:ATP-dependent Clp protease ATP-binding subunit ClpA
MQHEIDDKLATGLLSGTIRDGERVRVDVNNDALTVESMKE